MKWKTISEWVDQETGEKIKEEIAKLSYRVVKKESRTEITNGNGRRYIINICKKTNQLNLF